MRRAVRGEVLAAALRARELGHEGRALLVYLALVCPYCPGEREYRAWAQGRRDLVGRVRRRREPVRAFQGFFSWDFGG
jgi:hypothetical protein